jgi:type I restriction enzyme, S subunit
MKKATLSELCAISGGIPAPKETSPTGDVPFIRMRELGDAHLTTTFVPANEFLTQHDARLFAAKMVAPGATLFPRSGSVHLNHRALLRTPAVIVSHIAALVPNEKTDPEFLYHLLTSYDMTEIMTQTTGLNMIKFSQLKDVTFTVPATKIEQAKIAEILTLLDRAIKQTEWLIAKQERIKAGLMQDLLTKGIDEHGNLRSEATHAFADSPLGRIPVEWSCLDIQSLLKNRDLLLVQDGNHGEAYPRASAFGSEGVPFISAKHIDPFGRIDFDAAPKLPPDYLGKLRIGFGSPGDVVFAHNATVGPVGYVASTDPSYIASTSTTIYRANESTLLGKYVFCFLMSEPFQRQIANIMGQTTRNQVPITAQKTLYFLMPKLEEQTTITARIASVIDGLISTETNLMKLSHLRDGLMHDLLTGKCRVTTLLEPAATQ